MSDPGNFCVTTEGNPAVNFASAGYALFTTLGKELYQLALNDLNNLSTINIEPIYFNANFDFAGQLAAFVRPTEPVIDVAAFQFQDPGPIVAPPSFSPNTIILDPAPDQGSLVPPTLAFGQQPDLPVVADPIPPAPSAPIVVPAPPVYELPPVPSLYSLNLPPVPNIVLPTFDGVRPTFVTPNMDPFGYAPSEYISATLPALQATVATMIAGGTSLPPAIEQAMFDRGREEIAIEVERNIEAVADEISTRGFTEPNGIFNQRVAQARQDGQNKIANLNRDLTIQFHNQVIENVRFAVAQGIALEQLQIGLFNTQQQLVFQAAQYARETAVVMFNATVAVFNAELAAYQTDASVFATRIQGALAQVEVYRAEIEAQAAIGQINQQLVEIYTAQIQTINAMAEFYRSQIAGVQAQVDVNRGVIDLYRANVEAFAARWQAYASQVQAYSASNEAENIKTTAYRNVVEAYVGRVNAWNVEQVAKFEQEKLRIADSAQQIDVWKALLQQNQERLETERARLVAVASLADAQTRLYSAEAGVEQAASASTDRSFELGLEEAKAQVQFQLQNAQIQIQQNEQLLNALIDVRKAMAQISAQLAASIHSAMSFSAGVTSNQAEAKYCTTSLAYSGDAPDLGS